MKNKLIFVLLFVILGFVLMQVPVNTLAGSRVKFTLFDLFAPISGAFLGTVWGIVAVFAMQVANMFVHGANFDKGSIIRLFPTLFAVWYFANSSGMSFWGSGDSRRLQNHSKYADSGQVLDPDLRARMTSFLVFLVPLIAIISFNIHPIGRSVWYYSLFWLIPVVMWRFKERFLLARSLGATFTAHAVGGAIWIWAFNLPAAVWVSLIPVVILERSIFALGISASYIMINNVLAYLASKKLLPLGINLDKKYLL
ncbi:hypothetical protein HYU92_06775 [Candidatus Curtissbacteria bacterium]|nr:hypothetical protein [Candidatus Curtissbacteria bacterium]